MQLDSLLGKRYAQIGKIATVETHKRASLYYPAKEKTVGPETHN